MGLREDLGPYRDQDGMVLESPGSGTGNGILNKSIEMVLLSILKEISSEDVLSFEKIISNCEFVDGSVYPPGRIRGLYNRSPRKLGDMIGKDDYIGLAGASCIVGTSFARDIAVYGIRNHWVFNNIHPHTSVFSNTKENLQAWQGRFIYLVPYWKMCGGFRTCWLSRQILEIYFDECGGDESSRIQQWIMTRAMIGRMDGLDDSIHEWRVNLLKQYPKGMVDVMIRYYGASHPFAKYAPTF